MLQMFIDGLEREKQFRQAQMDGITIVRNEKGMQKYKPKDQTIISQSTTDELAETFAKSNVINYCQIS